MLRYLFYLAFFSLAAVRAFAQDYDEPTGLQRHQLTGPVKILVKKLFVYSDSNGGHDRHLKYTDSIWFNRQGNIKRMVKRDSVGKLAYLDIYTYDSLGHLRSLKSFDYPGMKKDMSEYRYYNAYGQLIRKKEFDWGNKSYSEDKYFYDNRGHCVRSLSAWTDLPLLPFYTPKYDHETKLKYDSLGRLAVTEKFNDSGKDAYVTNYYYYLPEYDSTVVLWRSGSKAIGIKNKAGATISNRNYSNTGNLESWYNNAFEEHGRVTGIKSYLDSRLITDFSSQYAGFDRYGNFGSVLHTLNGQPTQYIEQEMVYWTK